MGQKVSSVVHSDELRDPATVGLSPRQVELVKAAFHAHCKEQQCKGGLTEKALARMLRIPERNARALVQFADANDKGEIGEYDFVCLIATFVDGKTDAKLAALFQLFDADDSHFITADELEELALCVVSVRGGEPSAVAALIKRWRSCVFALDDKLTIADFTTLAKEDSELQSALLKLGVLSEEETRGLPADLEAELQRFPQKDKSNSDCDFFLAVRPFESVARATAPSKFDARGADLSAPGADLELAYVHGYRCHDTRNNIALLDAETLVFHTAAVGVVMNTRKNTQKFCRVHTDDITCLTFAPLGERAFVVTGEMGRRPAIAIWDARDLSVCAVIQGELSAGVSHVSVSSDGRFLVAVGANDLHDIAVYDVSRVTSPSLIVHRQGLRESPLALCILSGGKGFYIAGNRDLHFFAFNATGIAPRKISGADKWGSVTSLLALLTGVVCGSAQGRLFLVNGQAIGRNVEGHIGAVTSLCLNNSGFLSGGVDGVVTAWGKNLERGQQWSLGQMGLPLFNPRVRALAACESTIVVGTRGGQIVELTSKGAKIVCGGHFSGELWGLATHPRRPEALTGGEEGLLACWNVQEHRQLRARRLAAGIACLAASDSVAAVGCVNGHLSLIDWTTLADRITKQISKRRLSVVRFSPDSALIAVGSHDAQIYLLSKKDLQLYHNLSGHHSTITALDFSSAGHHLQSTCTGYELLYWDIKSGAQVTRSASMCDVEWASWTLPLGWPVQGVFRAGSDGTDVNCVQANPLRTLIACADDFGRVTLFRYPALRSAGFEERSGHSSHVTAVGWTADGDTLLSIGGNDKSLFVWKVAQAPPMKAIAGEELLDAGDFFAPIIERPPAPPTSDAVDFFMAVKPWVGDLQASTPADVEGNDAAPSEVLQLTYAFGYRSAEARQTAKWAADGHIAFVAAGLGAVLNVESNEQRFFKQHNNDVIALTIDTSRRFIATGQMAAVGSTREIDLWVWDAATCAPLANLKGFHRRAVQLLRFSPDGNLLLSFGRDDDNSLAVHEWLKARLLATSGVDKRNVLDAAWVDARHFYSGGSRHLRFWTLEGVSLRGQHVEWKGSAEAVTSIVSESGRSFAGTAAGHLVSIEGKRTGTSVDGHKGAILVLCLSGDGCVLFSGGKDGAVFEWAVDKDSITKRRRVLSLNAAQTHAAAVRVLDHHADTLLVGSGGGDLWIAATGKPPICAASGHYAGELWGLCAHPTQLRFVTAGDEGMIVVWDAQKRRLRHRASLGGSSRAISYSNSGHWIAATTQGKVHILNSRLQAKSVASTCFSSAQQWVQTIRFSPNDAFLALGAHGGASPLLLLAFNEGTATPYAVVQAGLTSALTYLDWSTDSSTLMLNSQAYELKFVAASERAPLRATAAAKLKWATWTCPIGWATQGIAATADGSEINCVARSNNERLLATGEDSQLVKLFRFPALRPNATFNAYTGHASHVTQVVFLAGDRHLVSVGGNDRTALLWSISADEDIPAPEFIAEKAPRNKYGKPREQEFVPENGSELAQTEQEDFFMAVRPWLGAIFAPASWPGPSATDDECPAINARLEYVHGFRAKDCRNGIFYQKGRLLYFAAALGIALDPATNTQRFLEGHGDDVTAMTVSEDGALAATGELGPKPRVIVWRPADMSIVAEVKSEQIKGIACLAFSPRGARIAGACIDDDHTIFCFNIRGGTTEFSMKGGRESIVDMCFADEDELVIAGVKTFARLQKGTLRRGSFRAHNYVLFFVRKFSNWFVSGNAAGELLAWKEFTVDKALNLGEASLETVHIHSETLIVGNTLGQLFFLDARLQLLQRINLCDVLTDAQSLCIRAVTANSDLREVFVGTLAAEVYRLTSDGTRLQGKSLRAKKLISGHFAPGARTTNEVWALAALARDGFLTASDDGTLRHWSIAERRQLRLLNLNVDIRGRQLPSRKGELHGSAKLRALAISSDEQHCAVGCKDGTLRVIALDAFRQILAFRHREEWISALAYSPDGRLLAAGSHNAVIDLYAATEGYRRTHVLAKHSSFITHIDWSRDSRFLQSNSGDCELLFWDAKSGKQLPSGGSALRNEDWETWTCVLGWPVQGIFKSTWDASDVNAVARSRAPIAGCRLLAAADDFSTICLYKYPCLSKAAKGFVLRGHASHVTNVCFAPSDEHLISTGGEDQTVMQWTVSSNK